ncbi:DUF6359 domain-containing protein [Flammeovirga sp. SJP92]|uniref:DUF6359 domain-containing protein n=1 Tax=Flammeovirga sp. SJP92 TaxID=1775430 RepID=UPI000788B0BE|nr:DUF6359 domain-containing protein [Flammeovirga sp. SJP92]KXX70303.1 hypothetical protein AVL50_11905 [Flammeovirga sp. SJP92]
MKTQTVKKALQLLLIGSFITMAFLGCTSKEVEGPGQDPEDPDAIETTHSIKELIAMYDDSEMMQITQEVVIKGTVISSDEEGNVYKYITIQDEEGTGIQVKLNRQNLYLDFAQGQEVVVKAEDLYLGQYGGLMQLGGLYEGSLGNIDEDDIDNHIIAGEKGEMPTPTVIDLNNLPSNLSDLYNTWVTVKNIQFVDKDSTYADVSEGAFSATNRNLTNVEGKSIIVRNSKFADFAGETMPSGSGEVSAILTVYNGANQLTLNSTADVNLSGARFEVKEGEISEAYTVAEAQKAQGETKKWVKGYIIGTINGKSLDDFNLGTANASGTNLVIADSKDETDVKNGMPVQLPTGFVRESLNIASNGELIGVMVWLKGDLEPYFSAPGLKETSLFSFDGETIEGEDTPDKPDTVEGAGPDILGAHLTNTSIDFSVWNESASTAFWFASNGNAYVNAYNQDPTTSWMITKTAVDISGMSTAYLTVEEKFNFFTSAEDAQVMVSTDYSGTGDPKTATWKALEAQSERASNGEFTSQFILEENAYVAFVYNGTGEKVMSWNVYTVEVSDEEIEGPEKPEAEGSGTLEDAYNVTAAQDNQDAEGEHWVKGIIVGSFNNGFQAGADNASEFNLLIAVNSDETATQNMVCVQLPGGFVRESLNLVANPALAGTPIWVEGSLELYNQLPGVKGVAQFSFDGENIEGDDDTEEPTTVEGAGPEILGSSLTNTTIDFTVWNESKSAAYWSASNGSAYVNAYNKDATVSWMITKSAVEVAEGTTSYITITEKLQYFTAEEDIQIMVSKDYEGTGDPKAATWQAVSAQVAREAEGDYTSQFPIEETAYVAFVYDGTGEKVMSWNISTVEVKEEEVDTPEKPAAEGDGTLENAYNVTAAQDNQEAEGAKWVKGMIIGTFDNGVQLGTDNASEFNLVIAVNADETSTQNMLTVQLPSGFVRASLNLVENAALLGTSIWLEGTLETYNGLPGVKSVEKFSFDGEKVEIEEEAPTVQGAGPEILGSSLTNTAIDFTVWNENESAAYWALVDGNAVVNAYNQDPTISWMITKSAVQISNDAVRFLTIKEKLSFFTSESDVQVMVSKDYEGTGDPKTALWTPVAAQTAREADGDFTSQFKLEETVYVAFVYNGTGESVMSWGINSVEVSDEEIEAPVRPAAEGTGILTDAYNVTAAQDNQDAEGNKWVKGIIVGTYDNGVKLGADNAVATNLLIAVNAGETASTNMLSVQLPDGFVRTSLNLVDNPNLVGTQVWLEGSLEAYYGLAGLKSVAQFSLDGATIAEPEVPNNAEGTGTLADAYNVPAAQATQDDSEAWVKGYIVGSMNSSFVPGASGASGSNIVLALAADETDQAKIVTVQLPSGFIRDELNLNENPDKMNTLVWVKGTLEAYFGLPGIKGVNSFSYDGATEEEEKVEEFEGVGTPINGTDLTGTSIDFTTYNELKSPVIWTAASGKASINAYQQGEVKSWLISKTAVDFSAFTTPRLYLTEVIKFSQGFETIKVVYSSDYSDNPTTATWNEFSVEETRAATGGEDKNAFVADGLGAVYIAFQYTADASDNATGWDIVTVVASEKEDDETPVEPAVSPGVNLGDDSVSGFSDLIFTEYIEGSSNNKYLEIFNGTGAEVDLSNYSVKVMSNANLDWNSNTALEGTLPNGATFVIRHGSAAITPDGVNTYESSTACNFNGDDRVGLFNGDNEIDRIGYIDLTDPSNPVRVNFGKDVTLVRSGSVRAGVVGDNDPTTNGEWTSLSKDDVSSLGAHTPDPVN